MDGWAHNSLTKVCGEDTRFAVVWVQQSDHRVGPWMAWRFSESLHEKYAKNLEAAHWDGNGAHQPVIYSWYMCTCQYILFQKGYCRCPIISWRTWEEHNNFMTKMTSHICFALLGGDPCSSSLLDRAFLAFSPLALGQWRILGLLPLPRAHWVSSPHLERGILCAFYDKVEALAKTRTKASEVAFGWEVLYVWSKQHFCRAHSTAMRRGFWMWLWTWGNSDCPRTSWSMTNGWTSRQRNSTSSRLWSMAKAGQWSQAVSGQWTNLVPLGHHLKACWFVGGNLW